MLNTIDFRNTSDTGEPEAPAIQPLDNGESANQSVLRRPTENTRVRTDTLRRILRERMVLQDFQAQLLTGGGVITFDGAKATYSGEFHITADLRVIPFATPGGAGAAPHIQSTEAALTVRGADPLVDVLTFTSRYHQWQRPSGGAAPDWAAEADQISIEIAHTGAVTVTVGGAADKQTNIYITVNYGTTTCLEVMNAVAANTAANKLVAVTYTGTGDPNVAPSPRFTATDWGTDYSARFLRGGTPGLVHQIPDTVLNTFFAAHVDNPLQKGDTLAIWYDALVNLAATGGRLQSTPENGNTVLAATSLFNTRREPAKIPDCIPICKCIDDNTLVFIDGSRIIRGTPASLWWDSAHLSGGSSSLISVTGWTRLNAAPGAHVPPTTVQEAFDNADDILEAILNGSQAFVSTGARPGITTTGNAGYPGISGTGGATSGTGIEGHGGAPNGGGVYGEGDGTGTGVYGKGGHAGGVGVQGDGILVGAGVKGFGGATNADGVYGEGGGAGIGVEGVGGATGGATAIGVKGTGIASGKGVVGIGGASGDGVYGESPANNGVYGKCVSGGGYGVKGESTTNHGVYGSSSYASGYGVSGAGVANNAGGVKGSGDGSATGVTGQGGGTSGNGVAGTGGAPNGTGVVGQGTGTGTGVGGVGGSGAGGTNGGYGLVGEVSSSGAGVAAIYGSGGAYNAHGVIGEGGEGGGYGVYAKKGDSWALYADNNSKINGQLEVNDADNGSWLHVINRNIWGDTGRVTLSGYSLASATPWAFTDADWNLGWDLGAGGHIQLGCNGLNISTAGYYRIDAYFETPAGGSYPYYYGMSLLYGATWGTNNYIYHAKDWKEAGVDSGLSLSVVHYCAAASHVNIEVVQSSTATLLVKAILTITRVLAP